MKNVKAIATAEDGSVDELAGDDNIVAGACGNVDGIDADIAVVVIVVANIFCGRIV